MTTRFIETYFAEGIKQKTSDDQIKKCASVISKQVSSTRDAPEMGHRSGPLSPWSSYWRGV